MRYLAFILINILIIFAINSFIFAASDAQRPEISKAQPLKKIELEDKIISSTFKSLAKVFVAVTDIDKLKKDNIEKLNKMKEEKFRKQYAKVYQTLKDCPYLLEHYGISENMTKEQVIEKIKSADNKGIYKIIDSVPDAVIAHRFKQYLSEKKQQIQKSNLVQQIKRLWERIIKKAKGEKITTL